MEVALLRLATTVVTAVTRSLVAPKPGAGLVTGPVRPLPRPAQPDRLAKVLGGRLAESYADVPGHERLAAVDAVRDAFAAGDAVTADRLFAAGLDPERLAAALPAPDPGLSERARGLHGELLALCCAHLVEQLTAEPSFMARAAVEQTRATESLREAVDHVRQRLGPAPDAATLDFEGRYARFIARAHSRMELFGLTLGRSAGDWPLETAYISLAVSSQDSGPEWWEAGGPERVTVKVEQCLAGSERLLLRGPAGSGKSTLVQWLAVNAARQSFGRELADWNRCVPFVLRLRAFTSDDRLPGPEDFLRAAGVPLHGSAPAGWADRLLSEGRGLVLVDGVDEVPMRLRQRTERWLKDLITAYPRSRYVVTTRPSAVPEGWLGQHGFVAHSMLPMERDDIRAFIRHWHATARGQCASEAEREQLDVYEASLRHAVGLRRDLGRLATNPLMCALLCALNRDRRMQLPRARKELYDAALDMLLVRRDTERDIVNVEGIDLTREEQTALLQRLAYWLIRNGQVEAARKEAVAMVAEWLRAMPQVAGTAEQAFSHLLIRSGLLREPAPGTVSFVHRTFLDYLGAKAAVEARDFGVLVRNAHDDGWDDVVQMAVGHARLDERTMLLHKLLHRSEEEPEHRHRLVLLAAASLDHAPELHPGIRSEVQARTEDLLPPLAPEDADELAKAGELVLDLLPKPGHLSEGTAAAIVRTAALIGGDAAFEVITGFKEDERPEVSRQLAEGWDAFTAETYAREVLSAGSWATSYLYARRADQLNALRHLPGARRIHVSGDHPDLGPLLQLDAPEALFLFDNKVLTDLSPLASMPSLTNVGISRCPYVQDLTPLATPGLRSLLLYEVNAEVSLDALRDMTGLESFTAQHPVLVESVGELPIGPQLANLALSRQARYLTLEGIERWPQLDSLTVGGRTQLRQLKRHPSLSALTGLGVHEVDHFDPEMIRALTGLRRLLLFRCGTVADLAPLRELPHLTALRLRHCAQQAAPIDLSPLAGLDRLTVTLSGNMQVSGTALFPPGRLIRQP
nr:NACHT domain-containing protein [Streptomyces sp. SID2563]